MYNRALKFEEAFMRLYTLSLVAILAISALLYGCGGASAVTAPGQDNQGFEFQMPVGPGLAQVSGDDVQITDDGKIVSNIYKKFFADAVNEQSWGRWNTLNQSGAKAWVLSNTYNSSPKAFVLGQNYWNRESDLLQSKTFTVPALTSGVRLTFTARWSIAAGDSCVVGYNTPGGPVLVANFTGGQNAAYPGWTKYYFELPSNDTPSDQTYTLQFYFSSDSSGNDWGFGLDDVAVYQRQLEAINDLSASDGLPGGVTITWSDNNAGTLIPDDYNILRSDFPGGPYDFVANVPYGAPYSYNDPAGPLEFHYYVVVSNTAGWPSSGFSNEDSGFAGP
jgi:hypothetical protein